ncbi:hypothetical protein DOY81_014178 [Sarcophaga bullata]|nr:hypothetical protein DOY81_014178 [Sarcophaga bullata]
MMDFGSYRSSRDFSRLAELHGLACILKVCCSYDSTFGVERLRQSCGGHGYLAAANLGNIFAETAAGCTYEGENSVLLLQVGKILMKVWSDVLASKQLMPTFSYLADLAQWERFPPWDGSWNCLVKAFKYASLCATRTAFRHCNERLIQGQSQNMTVNNTGLELTKAAELHGRAFVANSFYEEVVNGKNRSERSVEFQKVLENLFRVTSV